MHQTIRFLHAGQIEEINACDPTRTVLEYLREDRGLKGTKEGCAEGDCGACTVVIGELHATGISYRAVNSCILFLPTLDGKQLVTVEDLGQAETDTSIELHTVQQAMLDQHGSQCGFCTPGFVMSLFAMYHDQPDRCVNRTEIDLGLAGNLCRCTGYAPIVRAAEQALQAQRTDRFMEYEKQTMALLRSIQPASALEFSNENQRFYAPRTEHELFDLLEKHPKAVLVAGATDVGLWVTKQQRTLTTLIYLDKVRELKQIESNSEHLKIGAAVTYRDASGAITGPYPAFGSLIERIGASQVRNTGTIGGNIANGSPIGDMPPGLIALGARLELSSKHERRLIDLEDFFIDYGIQDLRAGECVSQILVPLPTPDQIFTTYKISKRFEQDISAVCGAFSLQLEDGLISNARVCFGGMAATPKRASKCEQALNGNPWALDTINHAMRVLSQDYTPLTDMRASASYRLRVAQNLLQRFYLEFTFNPYPVRLGLRYEQTGFETK